MTKAKALLAVAFLLVFGAGVLVGMSRQPRAVAEPTPRPNEHKGFLVKALNLTPAQDEQMKSIWSGVDKLRHEVWEKRRRLDQDRQEAILNLLTGEQHLVYDQIHQEYLQHLDELDKQVQQAVNDANERTMHILSVEQQQKFEKMRTDREQRRPHRPHPPGAGPTTGPVAEG
jgi:Spy/CpxP family protein refolding chaperone